jgi:hypothetical protein
MNALTTDPAFDINRTEEYKLSIQVSLDGFSFSVVHVHENRLLAFGQFPITVSSESFLGRRFTEWLNEVECCKKNIPKFSFITFQKNLPWFRLHFTNLKIKKSY